MKPHFAPSRRTGAIIPLVVILLPMVLIMCGVAINWAQLQLNRTELQVATDASCRAAGRMYGVSTNMNQALSKAQAVANKNMVNHRKLTLRMSDLQPGVAVRPSSSGRYQFSPQGHNANSIRLVAEKSTKSPSGPIDLYFPLLGGISTANLKADAISAQIELDIALVLDVSGSMAYTLDEYADHNYNPRLAPPGWQFGDHVPPGSRWADTLTAVQIFLDELSRYPQRKYVSLTTYATDAQIELPLSGSYAPIMAKLDAYTKSFPLGATAIGEGLAFGHNSLTDSYFARPFAGKVIIVMTDGNHNWGREPLAVADEISKQGILIYTVTFSDEANQVLLKQIADKGNGKHLHAANASQLKTAFREIARRIPTVLVK